jgi:thiol-disulfide isomerase/thioredoxin
MKCALGAVSLLASAALAADPATLSLPDLSGRPQTLELYRGRIVVLNSWATWCVPCRAEMPLLAEIQNGYASRGVVVIGASADDASTQAQIKPFVEKLRIPFPIWTRATTADMEQLGLGTALPATAILDEQGQIACRIIGVLERKDLTRRLDYLLSGKRGKAPELVIDRLTRTAHDHEAHDHETREHGKEEEHAHGGVGVEGASMVPS